MAGVIGFRPRAFSLPPVIPAKAGVQKMAGMLASTRVVRAPLSESGFTGLAGFTGFHFSPILRFWNNRKTPAKPNMRELIAR